MAKTVVKTGTKPLRARNAVHRADAQRKAAEAKARQEKYAGLTPQQRVTKLDAGNRYSGFKPLVATKERAKLWAILHPAKAEEAAKPEAKKAAARKERRS